MIMFIHLHCEVLALEFVIRSNKAEFKVFNGQKAKIYRKREDGFIEVYVPAMGIFILVLPDELEEC